MTLTLVITTGLKWSITFAIFGNLLVQLADVFKEKKPFTCLGMAVTGVVLLALSIFFFLEWLWSI